MDENLEVVPKAKPGGDEKEIDTEKPELSRRRLIAAGLGLGAFGIATITGLSKGEAASAQDAPSVERVDKMVQGNLGKPDKQLIQEFFGSDPLADIKSLYNEIDKKMGEHPSARKMPVDDRLPILLKAQNLKADGEREYGNLRLHIDEAKQRMFEGNKPQEFKQVVEGKIFPSIVKLKKIRDDLTTVRDNLNQKLR